MLLCCDEACAPCNHNNANTYPPRLLVIATIFHDHIQARLLALDPTGSERDLMSTFPLMTLSCHASFAPMLVAFPTPCVPPTIWLQEMSGLDVSCFKARTKKRGTTTCFHLDVTSVNVQPVLKKERSLQIHPYVLTIFCPPLADANFRMPDSLSNTRSCAAKNRINS